MNAKPVLSKITTDLKDKVLLTSNHCQKSEPYETHGYLEASRLSPSDVATTDILKTIILCHVEGL